MSNSFVSAWAPPLLWSGWYTAVSGVSSSVGAPANLEISFSTISDAPSSYTVEIQYLSSTDTMITETLVVGDGGSITLSVGGSQNSLSSVIFRVTSHSVGQVLDVVVNDGLVPLPDVSAWWPDISYALDTTSSILDRIDSFESMLDSVASTASPIQISALYSQIYASASALVTEMESWLRSSMYDADTLTFENMWWESSGTTKPGVSRTEYLQKATALYKFAESITDFIEATANDATPQIVSNLTLLAGHADEVGRLMAIALTDPLVIDLDGDGIETISLFDFGGTFDFSDGEYSIVRSGWISPDDGFIAFDRNQNGIIDNKDELFGNDEESGFASLGALDSNSDGVISSLDVNFGEILVWSDLNSNGISDFGEVSSAEELGIESINLEYSVTKIVDNLNLITARSVAQLQDGSQLSIYDVSLATIRDYSTDLV